MELMELSKLVMDKSIISRRSRLLADRQEEPIIPRWLERFILEGKEGRLGRLVFPDVCRITREGLLFRCLFVVLVPVGVVPLGVRGDKLPAAADAEEGLKEIACGGELPVPGRRLGASLFFIFSFSAFNFAALAALAELRFFVESFSDEIFFVLATWLEVDDLEEEEDDEEDGDDDLEEEEVAEDVDDIERRFLSAVEEEATPSWMAVVGAVILCSGSTGVVALKALTSSSSSVLVAAFVTLDE